MGSSSPTGQLGLCGFFMMGSTEALACLRVRPVWEAGRLGSAARHPAPCSSARG